MKQRPFPVVFFLVFLHAVTSVSSARADWPPAGLLVRDTGGVPSGLIGDGAGGVLMNWGSDAVQRISAGGELLITPGGPLLPGASVVLPCFSDGAGGMYIAALVNSTIVLLRAGPAGDVMWNVPVCETPGAKLDLYACSDGAGGALVAWSEARPLPSPQDGLSAYCQRVNSLGAPVWTQDGVRVRYYYLTPPHSLPSFATPVNVRGLTHSGTGGAHVFTRQEDWAAFSYPMDVVLPTGALDASNGAAGPFDMVVQDNFGGSYAAHIPQPNNQLALFVQLRDVSGTVQWDAPVCVIPDFYPYFSVVVRAVADGALVAWMDERSDPNPLARKLYVQKLDRNGSALWTLNGFLVTSGVTAFDVATDFHGGAIVVWADNHAGVSDIYMQRLSAAGAPMLAGLGMPVSPVPAPRVSPKLYSDPAGHGIVMWKSGETPESFAYRVDVATLAVAISGFNARVRDDDVVLGATLRSDTDVDFVRIYRAVADGALTLLRVVAPPARGQFEFVDEHVRPGTTYRYQLAVVDADGEFLSPIAEVSTPTLNFSLEQNRPNPFNPETTIRFVVPATGRAVLAVYSADGRLVRTIFDEVVPAGSHAATWDGRDARGKEAGSGIYFYRLTAGKHVATRKMALLK